jgi:hypothetical protein
VLCCAVLCCGVQVDHQQYITPATFLADAHLIIKCAEELYGNTEAAAVIHAPQPTPDAAAAPAGGAGDAAAAAGAVGQVSPAEDDPMLCSPDGLVSAAADTAACTSAAAAAAAGMGGAGGMAAPALPALRVSVCKEISRAVELKVRGRRTLPGSATCVVLGLKACKFASEQGWFCFHNTTSVPGLSVMLCCAVLCRAVLCCRMCLSTRCTSLYRLTWHRPVKR